MRIAAAVPQAPSLGEKPYEQVRRFAAWEGIRPGRSAGIELHLLYYLYDCWLAEHRGPHPPERIPPRLFGRILSRLGFRRTKARRRWDSRRCVAMGAISARWSVFKAGFQSAADPKYVVLPQRSRIRRGEQRGAARGSPNTAAPDRKRGSPAPGSRRPEPAEYCLHLIRRENAVVAIQTLRGSLGMPGFPRRRGCPRRSIFSDRTKIT